MEEQKKLAPRELLERYRFKGKVTQKFAEQAVTLVRYGIPPQTALRALGTADSTIRTWRIAAENGEQKYLGLFEALEKAEQESIARGCSQCLKAHREGWQSSPRLPLT